MVFIHFTRMRLHVGYLEQDWSNVWYEPDSEKNDEGESEIMLYRLVTGGPQPREPMEGQVKWHPHYDPKNCESSKENERKRMQKQFLTDAYTYLAEKDPEKIRTMEEEMDDPGFPRFNTWFKAAKKFKKAQMKRREYTRRRRIQAAKAAGATDLEAQKQVTSDTSDSAYESDEGDGSSGGNSTLHMPPPALPKKRKSASSGAETRKTPTKKHSRGISSGRSIGQSGSSPRMSGALGNVYGARAGSSLTNWNGHGSIDERVSEDGEEDDEYMDTRNPFDQPSPAPSFRNPWNFDPITPHSGQPTRGISLGTASFHGTGNDASATHNELAEPNGIQAASEGDIDFDPEERARRHVREQSTLGIDEDQALQLAIRISQEPQTAHNGEDVVDSIENPGDST